MVDPCLDDEDLVGFALGKLDTERRSSVHAHLDACETCQRVLAEAAHALAVTVTAPLQEQPDVPWNTTFQAGTLVGERYVIRQFIMRGGMGEVYSAFDRELRERIALKTVTSTACDNARAVERLKGEVQLARRVSHPNVCRIYDLGTHVMPGTRSPMHFLTMEFVDGETLGQRVRRSGALPALEAENVTRQLLLALRALHEAGVLHRDFKSDNVMLKPASEGGSTAMVLDFGLARAVDDGRSGVASTAGLVGTFGYLAPEQIEGRPHSIASDVYSFGVVWFELLTGQMPFDAEAKSALAAGKPARNRPPPPSSINPDVPSRVDALVLRCLERSPEDRFHSVHEILSTLDALAAPPKARARTPGLFPMLALCAVAVGTYGFVRSREHGDAADGPSAQRRPSLVPRPPSVESAQPLNSVTAATVPLPSASVARPDGPPATDAIRRTADDHRRPEKSAATPAKSRSEPARSAATPTDAPAPSSPTPTRPNKPDWENPFGATEPRRFLIGARLPS